MSTRRSRARRGATLVAAFVLVVAGLLIWRLASGEERFGSERLPEGRPVEIERTPLEYHVVYRVEEADLVTTEIRDVRRPFASRVESLTGPPPGDEVTNVQLSAFGRLVIDSARTEPTLFETGPTIAGGDLRPAPALAAALDDGMIDRREARLVAGRECQIYRAGGPIAAGELIPYDPGADEHTDFCVDEAGIVLEELWRVEGRTLRHRVAVEIEETAEAAIVAMPDADPIPVDRGGGSIRELTADSQHADTFWTLPAAPSGFVHRGRYAAVEPTGAEAAQDPLERGRRLAGIADVWVSGPDMLVLYQGGTLDTSAPFGPHPRARDVALGALGDGEAILDMRSNELRVRTGGGRFVRLYGTLELDKLVDLARVLESAEGSGELTYVEE